MAQLHYADQEARMVADADHDDALLPTSGYGGQPNQATVPKEEGYTSLGIDESLDDDNSEKSLGVASEEGANLKSRELAPPPPQENMAKELEDHSSRGDVSSKGNTDDGAKERGGAPQEEPEDGSPGIIDVQSLKEDFVDLSERQTDESDGGREGAPQEAFMAKELEGAPQEASLAKDLEGGSSGGGEGDIIDEGRSVDANMQESASANTTRRGPAEACPHDDETHGCESYQDDDGKEKIKVEGYNIYSGEPERAVYDAEEVNGHQHQEATDADAAVKPDACEGSSAREESCPDDMQDVPKHENETVSGSNSMENGDSKEHHDEHKESFTEHESSAVEQDVGLNVNSKHGEVYACEGGIGDNVPRDEEVGRELREPTERVDQEEERRPAIEDPLAAKEEGNGEMAASSGDSICGNEEEENVKGIAQGKADDDNTNDREADNIDMVPKKPPSMPHPQPEDLMAAFDNKNSSNGNDHQQEEHEGPTKKGVFKKIKDKLTPHFTSN